MESYNAAVMPASRRKDVPVSFRTSDEFKAILAAVADEFGGNQTSAIEFAVRDLAKRRGIRPKAKTKDAAHLSDGDIRTPSGASLTVENAPGDSDG